MDYFQVPGTQGRFYMSSSNGYSTWGSVGSIGTSCGDPSLYAGISYRIDTHDAVLGNRGWYLVAHVSEYGPSNPTTPYYLSLGQTVSSGGHTIGWTAWWGGGDPDLDECYDVDYSTSNHWHLEFAQPTHYSCYYPDYTPGQALGYGAHIGAIGSNATWYHASCW